MRKSAAAKKTVWFSADLLRRRCVISKLHSSRLYSRTARRVAEWRTRRCDGEKRGSMCCDGEKRGSVSTAGGDVCSWNTAYHGTG